MKYSGQLATGNGFGRNWIAGTSRRPRTSRVRRLQYTLPLVLLLSLLTLLPASATDETTLIKESPGSTSVIGGALTDGENVIWNTNSTSVHDFCIGIWAEGAELRVTQLEQGSDYALDQGYLLEETPAVRCQDNSSDMLEGGVFLVDLETRERQTLTTNDDFVEVVALDYPYAAWATLEPLDPERVVRTIWAINVETDSQPFEIEAQTIQSGGETQLYVLDDTMYWITTYGSGESVPGMYATTYTAPDVFGYMSGKVALAVDEVIPGGQVIVCACDDGVRIFSQTNTFLLTDDAAYDVATDGRYIYWLSGESKAQQIVAFDNLTNARFTVWEVQSDDPEQRGYIDSISGANGILTWTHRAYDAPWTSSVHSAEIAKRLPSSYQPDPGTTSADWTYYPETGHYLANDFRDFWNGNGGLPVFGYPMTEEFDYLSPETGNAHAAQMTERQRFEWHPENIGTPYAVLLGRLGETILQQQDRDWTTFAKADPSADHYFEATGHAIAPEFYDYWSSHGLDLGHAGVSFDESLALFGYPLSEPMMETNADGDTVLTQYFERAVFEFHPDNPESSQVLLRRLGAELLDSWEW